MAIYADFKFENHFFSIKEVQINSYERIVDVGLIAQSNTFYEFEFQSEGIYRSALGRVLAVNFAVS